MARRKSPLDYGQISLFHPVTALEPEPFPCDSCAYEIKWCCTYPETDEDYCVLGDKKIEK